MSNLRIKEKFIYKILLTVFGAFCFAYTSILTIFNVWDYPLVKIILIGFSLFCLFMPIFYWLLFRIIIPFINEKTSKHFFKIAWFIAIILSGLFLELLIPLRFFTSSQRQLLEIVATGERNPQSLGDEVRIVGLYHQDGTSIKSTGFSVIEGGWEQKDGQLIAYNSFPARLVWDEKTSDDLLLVLIAHPWSGKVQVTWNGEKQSIDLYADKINQGTKQINLEISHSKGDINRGLFVFNYLCAGISLGFTIFLFLMVLEKVTRLKHEIDVPLHLNVKDWIVYTFPMIIIWGVSLLAFWPGVMSVDSIDQWAQVQNGFYYDWHPVFHTLMIWLFTRIWNTPAIVAVFQIFALSLLVSWELGQLRRWGISRKVSWFVSFLFSISPVNIVMVNTLWKDIPYSIAVLALTFFLINISLNQKQLHLNKTLWILVGLEAFLIGLFRHNGVVVAFFTLSLLVFLFWEGRKVFLRAFALFLFVWMLAKGPLYDVVGAQKETVLGSAVALHQIAAHVYSGTELSEKEKNIIEQIQPVSQWNYNCYFVNPVFTNDNFNTDYLLKNSLEVDIVALKLFLKNPIASIKHVLCSGSMVYRLLIPASGYLYTTSISLTDNGIVSYIQPNSFGIMEESLIPGLARKIYTILTWSTEKNHIWFMWSPAFYLYLVIAIAVVRIFRTRSLNAAYFVIPVLVQSTTLFLVNIAQDFRYQYAVYLIAVFSLALLLLPSTNNKDQEIIQPPMSISVSENAEEKQFALSIKLGESHE